MIPQMKSFILSVIDLYVPKIGRPCAEEQAHYLDEIYYVLNSGCKWKHIRSKFHYSTYYKKFRYWTELGIFEIAHELICEILEKDVGNHEFYKIMYMDSRDVLNKRGSEETNYTFKFRGKKATRVNIVINSFGIPLAIHPVAANKYDSTLTEPTMNKIIFKIVGSRKYPKYLVADKGYTSKKQKEKLHKKGIHFIYPPKKNNKNIKLNYYQTQKYKLLMPSRHINENYFSWLTCQNRLNIRYDKLISTFNSFLHLGALHTIFNKLK